MTRVLVSACLLGAKVRYDGGHKRLDHPLLDRLDREGRLVSLCPETAAGLPVPRPPCEIRGPGGGHGVLEGAARVVVRHPDGTVEDLTGAFIAGAEAALATARKHGCTHALLTEGSPSCGVHQIYDGAFRGRKLAGSGVTAALLTRAGIPVAATPDDLRALLGA